MISPLASCLVANYLTGKRYLALKPKPDTSFGVDSVSDTAPVIRYVYPGWDQCSTLTLSSPDIVDSRVSISIADDINSCSGLENWLYAMSRERLSHKTAAPSPQPSAILGADEDNTVRLVYHSSSPVRPAASNPPSPEPESATSIAESYQLDLNDHPASHTLDANRALSSHPVRQGPHPGAAASPIPLPEEEFPVKLPSAGKEIEIRQPCPRRFASHPVLLQRASSISSSMYPRSVSDSPGPPPPRSPLRINRDPMSIEGLIAGLHQPRKATPGRMAPSIRSASDHGMDNELPTIIPSVVTECSGPIKRPKSRDRVLKHPLYPASRKEREERIKQRKLRDRPYVARTIDAVINAPPIPTRRLRKTRPHIQIPDLNPAPLTTRAPSAASSNASWKKVTENTMTPVSPVPSQEETAAGEKTGYTPTSANASDGSPSSVQMGLSPVMLVAEEVPLPKARSTPKPARLILRGEGSKYAPRPRSASMSRAATKRRSRSSIASISRPATPGTKRKEGKGDTPPLPSPPPNRALPPTPPASGSERFKKRTASKTSPPTDKKKELPIPPAYEILPPEPLAPRANQGLPHVSTQDQRLSIASRSTSITARLEALERQNEAVLKQNALLNAALMAVLKTNGSLNSPVAPGADPETPKGPMAWESRVARRSAASHAAASSNGSALEMYMSTRRGSQKGSAHEARG